MRTGGKGAGGVMGGTKAIDPTCYPGEWQEKQVLPGYSGFGQAGRALQKGRLWDMERWAEDGLWDQGHCGRFWELGRTETWERRGGGELHGK